MFSALRRMLEEDGDVVLRSVAPSSRHVRIDAPGRDGKALLDRYDLWKVAYDNNEGYWSLKLEIDRGRLARITTRYSPVEVP